MKKILQKIFQSTLIFSLLCTQIISAHMYKEIIYKECDKVALQRPIEIADVLFAVVDTQESYVIKSSYERDKKGISIIRLLTTTACISLLVDPAQRICHLLYFSMEHTSDWSVLELLLEDFIKPARYLVVKADSMSSAWLDSI